MWDKLHILREQYISQRIMDSIGYEKFCMISIVYNSSKIEGCTLTETETKVLLENNITAQGKPLTDHLMVKDHFNAFIKIKQDAINKRKLSIDFKKVPTLLAGLVKNVNDKIDKVAGDDIIKLSADIHYNFVNIHPFGDGNGRTSRLLMNYIQLYHNEPLIKIFTEDRAEYIDSLNVTEEKEDLNIFRDFICRQQIKFYESELNKFRKIKSGFSLLF